MPAAQDKIEPVIYDIGSRSLEAETESGEIIRRSGSNTGLHFGGCNLSAFIRERVKIRGLKVFGG